MRGRPRARLFFLAGIVAALSAGCGDGEGSWPQFVDMGAGLPDVSGRLAWGDYDGDGDLDLAVAGDDGGTWLNKVYRNEGGAFIDIGADFASVSLCSLAWADYDSDGDLDLALIGAGSEIYENQGNDVFSGVAAVLPNAWRPVQAWGDYDNDGDLDLAIAGDFIDPISRILRNEGGGSFTDINADLVQAYDCSLAWGDYDNDGDLDLAFAGWNMYGSYSKIYRNDPAGVFTDINAPLTEVGDCWLAFGDYDNDGDLDLALTGQASEGFFSEVYCNNGGGAFADVGAALTGVRGGCVAWGDCDNDGDLDLAIAGAEENWPENVSRAYRNDGDGVFTDILVKLAAVGSCCLAWGDFDSDGDLDLALAGYDGADPVSKIYRNDCCTANTPPTAPAALSADVFGTDVVLGWSVATDAETPVAGLSYNLRVRPESGTEDVMPGMADPATGYRHIPALGNAQKRCYWILRGLASGTYYWTVQAIDTAFAGSPWAPEETFTVP